MTVMLLDRHVTTQYHQQSQQPVSALKAPLRLSYSPSKAMRYYRLWIYTCNAVLFISVLGFSIVATKVLVVEPKRALVPGLSLTQPSFLYAYLALATQSGVLQCIGCLGARKLNERLLNIYWLLILVLLVGDAILGIVWVYRFDRITEELRPVLKQRLALEYGVDPVFTELWDNVQRQYKCCGVDSSYDYQRNVTLHWGMAGSSSPSPDGVTMTPPVTYLPDSCCIESPPVAAALRHFVFTTTTASSTLVPTSTLQPTTLAQPGVGSVKCMNASSFYRDGCEERLLMWLRQTADILFVLGYCVIAFLKLCFLGILRYEIREMIQKIKILQGELRAGLYLQEASNKSPNISRHEHNNGRVMSDSSQGATIQANRRLVPNEVSTIQAQNSLQNTPLHHANPSAHHRHLSAVMSTDIDSDTNSHCALLIPEDAIKQGHNNNYALQEYLLKRHHNQM
ncbi:CD82 antigen-like isoform X2 [Macrosteles quadrilineatus]|uniref:CD82 antigen-like isoform X2 n=1 Tax=Macrosteles quadrilineatus TaxID=74068 RepID=UPI0023E1C964|nr:CD82 antigen-like isoform X2 [Macrosteles quadrilineatus]